MKHRNDRNMAGKAGERGFILEDCQSSSEFSGWFFPEIQIEETSEMHDQRPSPLYDIIKKLKRRNSVSAATSAGVHPTTLLDNPRSDPWGSSEEVLGAMLDDDSNAGFSLGLTCTCQGQNNGSVERRRPSWDLRYAQNRNSVGYSSPSRYSGGSALGDIDRHHQTFDEIIGVCQDCGKSYTANAISDRRSSSSDMQVEASIHDPISPRRMKMHDWLDKPRIERLEAPRHVDALLETTSQLRILSQVSTDMDIGETERAGSIFEFLPGIKSNAGLSEKQIPSLSRPNSIGGPSSDYQDMQKRNKANALAAEELASLLWMCAHEMSLEDFGIVESDTFTSVFALVHSSDSMSGRMAGMAALDALIDAPSADDEKKAIKFANTLSGGLRSAHGHFEFLSAVSKALGHMARKNVDFVESEITRALEWLRTERSDRR